MTDDEWRIHPGQGLECRYPAHIIFTGGEATLRPDLPDLIKHAEDLGQVTGLLTNGLRLSETFYLQKLLQSGLGPSDDPS